MPATPPVGELRVVDAFPGITFDSPHGLHGAGRQSQALRDRRGWQGLPDPGHEGADQGASVGSHRRRCSTTTTSRRSRESPCTRIGRTTADLRYLQFERPLGALVPLHLPDQRSLHRRSQRRSSSSRIATTPSTTSGPVSSGRMATFTSASAMKARSRTGTTIRSMWIATCGLHHPHRCGQASGQLAANPDPGPIRIPTATTPIS